MSLDDDPSPEALERLQRIRRSALSNRTRAREVPDLLAGTRRFARRLIEHRDPYSSVPAMTGAGGQLATDLFSQTRFLSAQGEVHLFWISDDMTRLLREAARQLPDDCRAVEVVRRPIPHGFAVFETPLMSWASEEDFGLGPVPVGGLGWAGVPSSTWDGTSRRAVALIPFSPKIGGVPGLTPLASSYLFPHATFTEHLANSFLAAKAQSKGRHDKDEPDENRRLFVALALLLESTVAATGREHLGRAERRRAERADVPSEVRIVQLRRTRQVGGHDDDEHGFVEWSHRWIVSGHWRNQACGEGRIERRLTWVSPHVKGPDDKPLVVRDTVGALVR